MAKKKYKANILSMKSIEALKKDLKGYRDGLENKCRIVSERLASIGVETAKIQISDLDAVFKGELINSIHSERKSESVWLVVAGTDHAMFVEFGTGVVGRKSPYPYEFPDGVTWEYASGKTIRQLSDGRYGWFYHDDDGKWYFTEGMPSRPFMYNTTLELMKRSVEVVREVLK